MALHYSHPQALSPCLAVLHLVPDQALREPPLARLTGSVALWKGQALFFSQSLGASP